MAGCAVGAARQDGRVPETSFAGPLVGRDNELTRLAGVLERARGGEPRTAPVAGYAGVGRTRLLDEVVEGMDEHPPPRPCPHSRLHPHRFAGDGRAGTYWTRLFGA